MKILKVMVIDLQEVIKKGPDPEFEVGKRLKWESVYTIAILPETTAMFQATPNQVFIFFTEEENLAVQ